MEIWGTASEAAAAATPTIKIRGSTMMMMISARAAAIFMEAGGMSGREGVIHTSVSAGDRTRDHAGRADARFALQAG